MALAYAHLSPNSTMWDLPHSTFGRFTTAVCQFAPKVLYICCSKQSILFAEHKKHSRRRQNVTHPLHVMLARMHATSMPAIMPEKLPVWRRIDLLCRWQYQNNIRFCWRRERERWAAAKKARPRMKMVYQCNIMLTMSMTCICVTAKPKTPARREIEKLLLRNEHVFDWIYDDLLCAAMFCWWILMMINWGALRSDDAILTVINRHYAGI